MAGKSDFLESAILNHVFRNVAYAAPATVYLALYTVTPSDAGGGTEVSTSGTGYARQAVTFGAPTGTTQIANSADVVFPVCTGAWGTIVAFGIFDAASGGNLLAWGALAAGDQKSYVANDQCKIPTGSTVITED